MTKTTRKTATTNEWHERTDQKQKKTVLKYQNWKYLLVKKRQSVCVRIRTVHSYEVSIDDCIISWFICSCTVNKIGWNIISNGLRCGYRLRITIWAAIVIHFVRIIAEIIAKHTKNVKNHALTAHSNLDKNRYHIFSITSINHQSVCERHLAIDSRACEGTCKHIAVQRLLYNIYSRYMHEAFERIDVLQLTCNCDVTDHCLMVFGYRTLSYLVVLHRFVHASVRDETVLHLRPFPFAFLTFDQILQLEKRVKEENRLVAEELESSNIPKIGENLSMLSRFAIFLCRQLS